MAQRRPVAPKKRAPPLISDPVAYWKAQHAQAKLDSEMAREKSPSVADKFVRLEREAWREYKAAVAQADEPPEAGSETTLEGQLANTVRMRKAAANSGSHVAAAGLLRTEGEIAEAIRKRDEQAAVRAMRDMTESARFEVLVERLAALPPALKARVLATLAER